jgi:hypothetical protein
MSERPNPWVAAQRDPEWLRALPFARAGGQFITPARAEHDALATFEYVKQGDHLDSIMEVYRGPKTEDSVGEDSNLWIQIYCPLCWKGNGVPQPELSLKNHGPNPKHITLGPLVERGFRNVFGQPVRVIAHLLTVYEPIGCAECGTWKVSIQDGIARDIGKPQSFEPL